MPIRYQCDTCGSTLNIKDELAGSAGKCPKCKTAFVVPQPNADDADTRKVSAAKEATVRKPAAAPLKPKKATIGKPKPRRKGDDDFDPMAVLMGDESGASGGGGRRSSAPPPLSDDEIPSDFALDLELDGDDSDEPIERKPKKRKRVQFDLELGDDEPEEPVVRKSKKRKRVHFDSDDEMDVPSSNSASATATAMLSGGASAGAKDLLTRTMEESRARASRIDETPQGDGGPTIRDYINEYGAKAVGILVGFLFVVWGLYTVSNLATGGGMPLPELANVTGVITLDGVPLEGAEVRFIPLDQELLVEGKSRQKVRGSTAITNAEGEYDLYYIEDVRGAAVTEQRVVIIKYGEDGRLLTPADYMDFSMNTKQVESGSNEFNFDLKSDAGGARAGGGR